MGFNKASSVSTTLIAGFFYGSRHYVIYLSSCVFCNQLTTHLGISLLSLEVLGKSELNSFSFNKSEQLPPCIRPRSLMTAKSLSCYVNFFSLFDPRNFSVARSPIYFFFSPRLFMGSMSSQEYHPLQDAEESESKSNKITQRCDWDCVGLFFFHEWKKMLWQDRNWVDDKKFFFFLLSCLIAALFALVWLPVLWRQRWFLWGKVCELRW